MQILLFHVSASSRQTRSQFESRGSIRHSLFPTTPVSDSRGSVWHVPSPSAPFVSSIFSLSNKTIMTIPRQSNNKQFFFSQKGSQTVNNSGPNWASKISKLTFKQSQSFFFSISKCLIAPIDTSLLFQSNPGLSGSRT